jgi:hypothetical protein
VAVLLVWPVVGLLLGWVSTISQPAYRLGFLGASFVGICLLVAGIRLGIRNKAPARPPQPKRFIAKRRHVGREPQRLTYEVAFRCVICGRPLSNPASMRARVGSTCIKTYGPQYKKIRNPEHVRWEHARIQAEEERMVEQAQHDLNFERAVLHYCYLLHLRDQFMVSPVGLERQDKATVAKKAVILGLGGLPLTLMAIAMVEIFT